MKRPPGKRSACSFRSAAVVLALVGFLLTPVQALEAPDKFIVHGTPRELDDVTFTDVNGRPLRLSDFKGKVILLNIWATWCGPCRTEMPTLDRLQATLGWRDFEVVALSVDRAGLDPVKEFFTEIGIRSLAIYIDESGKSLFELRARGLPTTLLIDRTGREIGRLVGPAEWNTPEMIRFFSEVISREDG